MPRIFMPIASAFAPNYTLRDVLIACRFICPTNWSKLQSGTHIARFEENFREYMDAEKAISFMSGRSGFYAILKAMDIREGDEIILQAFTTVALPNTIKLFGAKPIFVDIEAGSLNMDPMKIEAKITERTKAIIIQHTFGNPADMDPIMAIANEHRLLTIEDCAHSLGAKYRKEKTGTFADAAFFSFGRDKVISAVSGGMVIAKDRDLFERIETIRNEMPFPAQNEIIKQLLHPIVTFVALHTYNFFGLGRLLMFLAFRFTVLDKAYTTDEKKGEPREDFAKRMPNALAAIGLHQMKLLNRFNRHRIKVAERYAKNIVNTGVGLPQTLPIAKNIYLWYTISTGDKKRMIRKAEKSGIILGDWFPQAIGPIEVDLEKADYEKGSCPIAEQVSRSCVNLPTHHNIHKREAERLIEFINNFK